MAPAAPYRLETLGTLSLTGPTSVVRASDKRQQRRRLALLATLACAGERGMSRDQLLLLFWPDSTQKKARHSLDQLLYAIRTSVGEGVFAGVNPIRLDVAVVWSDVADFNREITNGNLSTAVELYRGPFLEGFYLSETQEFEEWVSRERERLAHRYIDALEKLALDCENSGHWETALCWRRKLIDADPVSSRYAVALMNTLTQAGDLAAAIAHGEHYKRISALEIGSSKAGPVDELLSALQARHGVQGGVTLPVSPLLQMRGGPPASPRFRRSLYASLTIAVAIAVATAISFAVLARGPIEKSGRLAYPGTANATAYELYRRGTDEILLRNDSTALVAFRYLDSAAKIDPTFAGAYAAKATLYQRLAMSNRNALQADRLRDDAIASARKAIQLDPSLPEAHATLGLVESFFGINAGEGESELRRALELNPALTEPREYLAMALVYAGKPADALSEARLAVSNDPLSPTAKASVSQVLYVLDRCGEAMPMLDSLALLNPPLLRAALTRALCLARLGKSSDAVSAIRPQAEQHRDFRSLGVLGFALALDGNRSAAEQIRDEILQASKVNRSANYYAAMVTFALGNTSRAVNEFSEGLGSATVPVELLGPPFIPLMSAVHTQKSFAARPAALQFAGNAASEQRPM